MWAELVQPARVPDMKFIRDSWLHSYKRSPWAGVIANNLYGDVVTQTIDQLLMRGAKLLTVRNAANPELLVAWICYEELPRGELCIHAIYTKPVYRRSGAAKALLDSVFKSTGTNRYFYTFRTANSKFLKGGTYRPEIGRRYRHKSARGDSE